MRDPKRVSSIRPMTLFFQVTYPPKRGRYNVRSAFNRGCAAVEVETSLPGTRFGHAPHGAVAERGETEVILVDAGPEISGEALGAGALERRVHLQLVQSRKPVENAYARSLQGKSGDEGLNQNSVLDLDAARSSTGQ
jgi:hypothetical protein